MRSYTLPLLLGSVFAVAVGDYAFRSFHPSSTLEYAIGGKVRQLTLARGDSPKKHLYLRRSWHLSVPPESAWIEVLGHDCVEVFVNGRRAGRTQRVGHARTGGMVADISQRLHAGLNVIAVHAWQLVMDRPPAVAIQGQCENADGRQMSLDDPQDWRATDTYERRGTFWYETDFNDDHWLEPHVGDEIAWRTQVDVPPRAVTQTRQSQWITPATSVDGNAAFAQSFVLSGTPRKGWMRVVASGPYCLAVNGWVISDDRTDLAMLPPNRAVERTIDISSVLRRGQNSVSLSVTTLGEAPRVRADLEASTANGHHVYVATDETWRSEVGQGTNWQDPDFEAKDRWQPCHAESGYVGIVPRTMQREFVEASPPLAHWIARTVTRAVFIIVCGLLAVVGCQGVNRLLRHRVQTGELELRPALPYLALLPSSVLAFVAGLMTWDWAWTSHEMYRPWWLAGLVLLVVTQWLLIILITGSRWKWAGARVDSVAPQRRNWQHAGFAVAWLLLCVLALWLRLRHITAEPMHHDEVLTHMFTQSVVERGFPGGMVHPPFSYSATNELSYYATALCELFTDDPRLVVRIPSVFWSMATLLLLGYVGRRMFDTYVGVLAGALFAVSPHVLGMANFGRYLSQTQFFTLLTMFLCYEAFRGTSQIRVAALWGAAVSFVAMYLSWEGAGVFGVGLALAVLIQRRRHLREVFACPSVYAASLLVVLVVLGQHAHRVLQQTQRLWYGQGISNLKLTPMWQTPLFDPDYYLLNASWIRDSLLPLIALGAACFLAVNHRWRFPLRFLIICLVANAGFMSLLLPLRTNRYSYHLTQFLILIFAAVTVAAVEALVRNFEGSRIPIFHRYYARVLGVGTLLVTTVLASGWLLRTSEMKGFAVPAFEVNQLRNPAWEGPSQFVLDHLREDDVIISLFPHAQNFAMLAQQSDVPDPRTVDYWLESKLVLQAALADSSDSPMDRRSRSVMLYDVKQIEQLFAQHQRIWYCTMRHGQSHINDSIVSKYLREHMDVVYEDFRTAVMLRDKNHRTAPIRLEEEEAGRLANELYLR